MDVFLRQPAKVVASGTASRLYFGIHFQTVTTTSTNGCGSMFVYIVVILAKAHNWLRLSLAQ
jgi:hypothetical protein